MGIDNFYKFIASRFPELGMKLRQASMPDSEDEFIKKTLTSSLFLSVGLTLVIGILMSKLGVPIGFLFLCFPVLVLVMFFYFLKFPDVKIIRLRRGVDSEIIFAGRFLIIELESGIPIYDAFRHVADNYSSVGRYFRNIAEDIDLGTPMEVALNRAVDLCPSPDLRRILWQVMSSLNTGANISRSLEAVVEQIVREQRIELNEYGRKLNPVAMFYLILAVILPSIGVTMFVILVSFLSIKLTLSSLLTIAAFMAFVQFLFYTVVRSSRPASQIE